MFHINESYDIRAKKISILVATTLLHEKNIHLKKLKKEKGGN